MGGVRQANPPVAIPARRDEPPVVSMSRAQSRGEVEPLHEALWNENRDLALACRSHPFVRGLADGTLELPAFQRYVAQDAYFLRAFARAFALAAARSPDMETWHTFRELLDGAAQELQLHTRYSETLGIDLERVSPYAATQAYTDFLLATAWHSSLDETVAAMTPCMRLYAFLGKELAEEASAIPRASHPYRDWIETYSGAEFQAGASRLEALLDRLATDRPAIRNAYRYAMQCELRFFSAPLEAAS